MFALFCGVLEMNWTEYGGVATITTSTPLSITCLYASKPTKRLSAGTSIPFSSFNFFAKSSTRSWNVSPKATIVTPFAAFKKLKAAPEPRPPQPITPALVLFHQLPDLVIRARNKYRVLSKALLRSHFHLHHKKLIHQLYYLFQLLQAHPLAELFRNDLLLMLFSFFMILFF